MHKFAYLMCKNGVLSEENFEWREFIRTQMAREASDNFYERELILLPEEDEFRWSESDCIRGGRTRILKMLYDPDISFEQNEEKLADLWDAMQPDLSTIDYGDSELLISHYEEALLNTDDMIRIEGKMKADICVFLNWINSQFLSKNLFSLQMVDDFYDQIFDEQSAEVEQNEHDLVDLIFEIKTQLEKILAGHSMKSSELGLLKAWPKWHAKHWDDYGPWMRQLHGHMFVQLLKVDENFAQKLKNGVDGRLTKPKSGFFGPKPIPT
uniref:Tryptophan 2,3-dioxygenase n=1 Tax=Globodera pallida TaxID=36090 RepID=A0A183CJX6_GLOPA